MQEVEARYCGETARKVLREFHSALPPGPTMSLSAKVAVLSAGSDLASSQDYTQRAKNPPAKLAMQVRSLSRKIPWRGKWQPLHYPCRGNPVDRGILGVAKTSETT